jgi:pilus assembly protein CpaF
VWVDDGAGLRRCAVSFADEDSLRRTAQRLLAGAGRSVDVAHPYADAQLGDGVRLHVVGPPVTSSTVLSLRVLRRRPFTFDELAAAGAVDARMADALDRLVRARVNVVVTGGTGAGKTTLLAALLDRVPTDERVVIVEDTPELVIGHPHAVHLRTRAPNAEGAGAVTLSDLVRQALRMRPDRLVVGEARGAEVVELLAALNTGHAGSASTLHANSPADLVARLVALGTLAGVAPAAVERQLAAAVEAVVHVARDRAGRRRVASIGVVRAAAGDVVVEPALVADRASAESAPGWARLRSLLAAA